MKGFLLLLLAPLLCQCEGLYHVSSSRLGGNGNVPLGKGGDIPTVNASGTDKAKMASTQNSVVGNGKGKSSDSSDRCDFQYAMNFFENTMRHIGQIIDLLTREHHIGTDRHLESLYTILTGLICQQCNLIDSYNKLTENIQGVVQEATKAFKCIIEVYEGTSLSQNYQSQPETNLNVLTNQELLAYRNTKQNQLKSSKERSDLLTQISTKFSAHSYILDPNQSKDKDKLKGLTGRSVVVSTIFKEVVDHLEKSVDSMVHSYIQISILKDRLCVELQDPQELGSAISYLSKSCDYALKAARHAEYMVNTAKNAIRQQYNPIMSTTNLVIKNKVGERLKIAENNSKAVETIVSNIIHRKADLSRG